MTIFVDVSQPVAHCAVQVASTIKSFRSVALVAR